MATTRVSPHSICTRLLIGAALLEAACVHGAPESPPTNAAPASGAAPLRVQPEEEACAVPTAAQPLTRSTAYDDQYEAALAFDDQVDSQWISAPVGGPAWIAVRAPDANQPVTGYALHFSNGKLTSRAPRDWRLLGWDGGRWVVLDERAEQTRWLGKERRTYELAAPGVYAAYCLRVTDDNDPRAGVVVISLGSLELQ
jgi:hypothetical protein